ncbi:hypothetical protein [Coleofasciculus sp. E2-BRE-01]|uniref:hypothetical protein n=1 Tax=Coleofasciculus sp. E2-BRE-01 TaxID=3069524 RepID=UPI0032F9E549
MIHPSRVGSWGSEQLSGAGGAGGAGEDGRQNFYSLLPCLLFTVYCSLFTVHCLLFPSFTTKLPAAEPKYIYILNKTGDIARLKSSEGYRTFLSSAIGKSCLASLNGGKILQFIGQ